MFADFCCLSEVAWVGLVWGCGGLVAGWLRGVVQVGGRVGLAMGSSVLSPSGVGFSAVRVLLSASLVRLQRGMFLDLVLLGS
ncbi:hypothetical protein U1Q18_017812, partial [Sarracenia purpurea var. burkii]